MALGQVAEEDHDCGGDTLGQHRVHVCLFDKYLKEYKIERQVEHANHEIPEKLDPAFHVRIAKDDIFGQEEADRESNAKGCEQGGAMCLECIEPKIELPALEYVFVTDEVNKDSQQGISPSGGRIAKCLQVHDFPERRIEKINDRKHQVPYSMNMPSHCRAK
jgi:hypothetical protein